MDNVFNQSMVAQLISENTGIELDMSYKYTSFRFPLWGLIFYLLCILLTAPKENASRSLSKSERKFGRTETVMFLHNLILAIFSALCFISTAPIIYSLMAQHGVHETVCTRIVDAWDSTSYGFWVHLFYLSKFYEFADTFIVIWRGRRPITLQVFHHCGAVIGLWLCMVARTGASFWFVVENSFIHSIMYTYYACSVLGIKFRAKFIITLLQISQFVIGLSGTVWQWWQCQDQLRSEEKVTMGYHLVYVSVLLYMFSDFYMSTYKKKNQAKQQ